MNPLEYQHTYELEETHWWFTGMRAISFALLDAALPNAGAPRILDAGCGTGAQLMHLSQRGRAVGIDISEDALRYCRVRGVRAAQAGIMALPFADQTFDCVTCFDVLYHRWVTDDAAAVRELARVLRPGGVLLLRVAAYRWLWSAHDEAVHARHRYLRREVVAMVESGGFEIERATYCNSVLLPLIIIRRGFDRWTGRQGSDLAFLPRPLEWLLRRILELEARWLRRHSLSFGASITALCRKPAVPTRDTSGSLLVKGGAHGQ